MPGAMCGFVVSLGTVLSIIHEVGPLSNTQYYSNDIEYTSFVLNKMSKIGEPRCCKRNAFLSISTAAIYIKNKYDVEMKLNEIKCEFSCFNK